jgi:hypothetical protein
MIRSPSVCMMSDVVHHHGGWTSAVTHLSLSRTFNMVGLLTHSSYSVLSPPSFLSPWSISTMTTRSSSSYISQAGKSACPPPGRRHTSITQRPASPRGTNLRVSPTKMWRDCRDTKSISAAVAEEGVEAHLPEFGRAIFL